MTFIDTQILKNISRDAGLAILNIYNDSSLSMEVEAKSDNSPLTKADKAANEVIVAALKKFYPHIPLISEEEKEVPFETRKNWDYFWLIDPLDGTKEFIKRNGEFTVNIALIHHNYPVQGFIYVPVTDEYYFTEGNQAFYQKGENEALEIKVANKTQDLIALGSRSHAKPEDEEFLSKLPIAGLKNFGSSLKFCKVADATADIYYRSGPTMEWDTAAGQAILEKAGGRVTSLNGERFSYNKVSLLNAGFVANGSGVEI